MDHTQHEKLDEKWEDVLVYVLKELLNKKRCSSCIIEFLNQIRSKILQLFDDTQERNTCNFNDDCSSVENFFSIVVSEIMKIYVKSKQIPTTTCREQVLRYEMIPEMLPVTTVGIDQRVEYNPMLRRRNFEYLDDEESHNLNYFDVISDLQYFIDHPSTRNVMKIMIILV